MPNIKLKNAAGTEVTYTDITKVNLVDADSGEEESWAQPTGLKLITDTNETDVKAYATAQVSDPNLIPSNIKNGVSILGVTGSSSGDVVYSWDETTLTLTITEY